MDTAVQTCHSYWQLGHHEKCKADHRINNGTAAKSKSLKPKKTNMIWQAVQISLLCVFWTLWYKFALKSRKGIM